MLFVSILWMWYLIYDWNFNRSSGQKNMSFMEMMKSAAKGSTQEDEVDDEEDFVLKKETSTTTTTATTPYKGMSPT